MYWNHWHMGGWISLAWILAILGVLLVLSLAAMARRRDRSSGESPERTLKRRYAQGEIDRDTFERMLADLRG